MNRIEKLIHICTFRILGEFIMWSENYLLIKNLKIVFILLFKNRRIKKLNIYMIHRWIKITRFWCNSKNYKKSFIILFVVIERNKNQRFSVLSIYKSQSRDYHKVKNQIKCRSFLIQIENYETIDKIEKKIKKIVSTSWFWSFFLGFQ